MKYALYSPFQKIIIVGFSVALFSCAGPEQPPLEASPYQAVVSTYADAYNAGDIVAMSKLMHDEIEWINIEGSEQTIITANKNALIGELAVYFEDDPKSVSTLSDWSANGNFVSVKESVASPAKEGETRVQASHSIYEFEDGLIRRVWYFPAQKN